MVKLQPYLNFAGNAREAFDLYRSVFGGEFAVVVRFKDMPMDGFELSEEDGDKLMHIALPIGEADVLMASDTLEAFGQPLVRGNASYVSVHPSSREEAGRIFAGLSEGGEVGMPLADQPWGYYGSFTDRFGVGWMVNVAAQPEA